MVASSPYDDHKGPPVSTAYCPAGADPMKSLSSTKVTFFGVRDVDDGVVDVDVRGRAGGHFIGSVGRSRRTGVVDQIPVIGVPIDFEERVVAGGNHGGGFAVGIAPPLRDKAQASGGGGRVGVGAWVGGGGGPSGRSAPPSGWKVAVLVVSAWAGLPPASSITAATADYGQAGHRKDGMLRSSPVDGIHTVVSVSFFVRVSDTGEQQVSANAAPHPYFAPDSYVSGWSGDVFSTHARMDFGFPAYSWGEPPPGGHSLGYGNAEAM